MRNRRRFLKRAAGLSVVAGSAGCTETSGGPKGDLIEDGKDDAIALLEGEFQYWTFSPDQPVVLEYSFTDDSPRDGLQYDVFLMDEENRGKFTTHSTVGETELIAEGSNQVVTGDLEDSVTLPAGTYYLYVDNSTWGKGKPRGAYAMSFEAEYEMYEYVGDEEPSVTLEPMGDLGSCEGGRSVSVEHLEFDEGFGDYQMRYDVRFRNAEPDTTYRMDVDMGGIGTLSQTVTAGVDQHTCEIAFVALYEPSGPDLDEGDRVDARITISDDTGVLAQTRETRRVTD